MSKKNILVIDDEMDIRDLLSFNLNNAGYEVNSFGSPNKAINYALNNHPDLVLCDWMMDEMDGLEVCKNFKRNPELMDIPFVMLTCKGDEIDVVTALEVGADEYITKPVRIREIIARIKKLMANKKVPAFTENYAPAEESAHDIVQFESIVLNSQKYKVWIDEEEIELTRSEFKLLQLLMMNRGRVFTRHDIIEKLNGMDHLATERSVDVLVVGLRKKLKDYKQSIETVRGVGYRFKE